MLSEEMAYASKAGASVFTPFERRFAAYVLPKIPRRVETYHLTWLTLLWSVLIACGSYLAGRNIKWLWLVSLMIALHYVTDFLDGKLGKYRQTGLVKWGFLMDHFLDYFFLCSLLIGYSFILPPASTFHLFLVFAVFAGFMLHSFLAFAVTGKLRISVCKLGPTEFRLALITINTLLIYYGTKKMIVALPYVAFFSLIALCLNAYRTQKAIWRIEMRGETPRS